MTQHARRLLAVLVALTPAGCDAPGLVGPAGRMWLWLAAPLTGLVLVGWTLAWARRRARRRARPWSRVLAEPPVQRVLLTTVVVALAGAVAFALYTVGLEIDPSRKLWNIGLWFLGTILGTSVALVLGLAGRR